MPQRLKGWFNSLCYAQTEESFIISPMPKDESEKLSINQYQITDEGGIDPTIFKHDFLAAMQNSYFAITPVHTTAEKILFMDLIRPLQQINLQTWNTVVQQWNKKANGKDIFYKSIEYLQMHYRTWQLNCAARNTFLTHRAQITTLERSLTNQTFDHSFTPLSSSAAPPVEPDYSPLRLDLPEETVEHFAFEWEDLGQPDEQPDHIDQPERGEPAQEEAAGLLDPSFTTKKKNKRKCTVCQSNYCPGNGNKQACKGLGFNPDIRGGVVIERTRAKRTCSECKSNSCKGRGGKRLCPLWK